MGQATHSLIQEPRLLTTPITAIKRSELGKAYPATGRDQETGTQLQHHLRALICLINNQVKGGARNSPKLTPGLVAMEFCRFLSLCPHSYPLQGTVGFLGARPCMSFPHTPTQDCVVRGSTKILLMAGGGMWGAEGREGAGSVSVFQGRKGPNQVNPPPSHASPLLQELCWEREG